MIQCTWDAAYVAPFVGITFSLMGIFVIASAGSNMWADINKWWQRIFPVLLGLFLQTFGYIAFVDWYTRCIGG